MRPPPRSRETGVSGSARGSIPQPVRDTKRPSSTGSGLGCRGPIDPQHPSASEPLLQHFYNIDVKTPGQNRRIGPHHADRAPRNLAKILAESCGRVTTSAGPSSRPLFFGTSGRGFESLWVRREFGANTPESLMSSCLLSAPSANFLQHALGFGLREVSALMQLR